MINKCPTCLTFRKHQTSEPIIDHPIPNQAWKKKIAADPFHFSGHYYLLMIDYYSKFIIIQNLNDLQSSTVINKSKQNSHNLGPQRS